MPIEFKLRPFRVNPKSFHEFIVLPQFGDVIDDETGSVTQPSMEEGDWMLMDNVKWRVPILELTGSANVIKRRDATCKLIYSPVGRLGSRYIYAEEMYAATEDCVKEFYQGCFIDFEQGNYDMIFENLMPILEKGVATDIYGNKYFGDIERPADTTLEWSWNKFDGIFTHLARYIATGVLPAAQTFSITTADSDGIISPTEAHDYLEDAYNAQPQMMKSVNNLNKAIYVDYSTWEAYYDWLVLAGQSTVQERQSGATTVRFRGIEVRPKYWDGILAALNGGDAAHLICLTLRANWIYLTDSQYGGGPKNNEAVRVWYSMDDDVWRRQIHFKSGTEWVNPRYTVFGITSF